MDTIYEVDVNEESEETPAPSVPAGGRLSVHKIIITVAAALLGSIVGSVPVTFASLVSGHPVALTFVCIPIAICLFIHILGGSHGIEGLIGCIVFSLVGAHSVAAMCSCAEYVAGYRMSVFSLPLVAVARIGSEGLVGFGTDYTFPLLFTALGVAMSYLTLKRH